MHNFVERVGELRFFLKRRFPVKRVTLVSSAVLLPPFCLVFFFLQKCKCSGSTNEGGEGLGDGKRLLGSTSSLGRGLASLASTTGRRTSTLASTTSTGRTTTCSISATRGRNVKPTGVSIIGSQQQLERINTRLGIGGDGPDQVTDRLGAIDSTDLLDIECVIDVVGVHEIDFGGRGGGRDEG